MSGIHTVAIAGLNTESNNPAAVTTVPAMADPPPTVLRKSPTLENHLLNADLSHMR